VLPQSGAKEKFDSQAGAAYSYDKKKKTFISYDNPDSVKMKADYIKSKGLRGAMFWETSGDATTAGRSLIANVAKEVSRDR
jgi:chitinase